MAINRLLKLLTPDRNVPQPPDTAGTRRQSMKYSKLILKNILRNKRRTFLTISSLVVSLFLIITLATILTEFTRGSSEANPARLVTRHSVSLVFPLPAAYQQRI